MPAHARCRLGVCVLESDSTQSPSPYEISAEPATASEARLQELKRNQRKHSLQSTSSLERLLKVGNDIIDMLSTHRDADSILSDSRVNAFLYGKLFMSRGPRVNSEGLHIPNTVADMISSRSFSNESSPHRRWTYFARLLINLKPSTT